MVRILVTALFLAVGAASAAPQSCPRSVLYLGSHHANGLFVNEAKRSALYTRSVVDADALLASLNQGQASNIRDCSTASVPKCIEILLDAGRIVLAFQNRNAGQSFTAADVTFKITQVKRDFGVGLGDMYWVEYRSVNGGNTSGHFTYSSKAGVLSISIRDRQDESAGPSLFLVQSHGLLADNACRE